MSGFGRILSLGGTGATFRQANFWDSASFSLGGGDPEREQANFGDYEQAVELAYKRNGVVFACIQARSLPLSEARFLYQNIVAGRPGELVDGPGLELLNNPWPNGTTGELITSMEQDDSLGGNSFWTTADNGRRLRRLRPDWVTIVSGVRGSGGTPSPLDIEAEPLAYIYKPEGSLDDAVVLDVSEVVHYSPTPDPLMQWRGMSWLEPALADIAGDSAAAQHKLKYFEQGASGKVVVTYDPDVAPEEVAEHAEIFKQQHAGTKNAYKTLHIGGGSAVSKISADMKEIDFKAVTGSAETRIAAAAGVGAIIARLSEGMQGSSLNQGNYNSAKRQVGDMTLRPLWRNMAGALSKFTTPGEAQRLWYDTRDIEFLKEDAKDEADIFQVDAQSIRALTDGGYDPESVVQAVESRNPRLLRHSGKLSVQLQNMDGDDAAAADVARAREIAEIVQKIYLGVANGVITEAEARQIINRAGAGLSEELPASEDS